MNKVHALIVALTCLMSCKTTNVGEEPVSGENMKSKNSPRATKPPSNADMPSKTTAPPVAPLPHDRVPELLDRLSKNDKIDLPLVYQALVGPQTTLRARAAQYLGAHGDSSSILHLINALADDSSHVGANYANAAMATTRYWANASLEKLTKQDFGFVWSAAPEQRAVAIKAWRMWYASKRRLH